MTPLPFMPILLGPKRAGKPVPAPAPRGVYPQDESFNDAAGCDRFLANVRRSPEDGACWRWQGSFAGREYGRIMVRAVRYPAHVFSWMLHNRRPFPTGKYGLHTCDNPWCVNPEHIVPGTQHDNMQDCRAKGRLKRGRGANGPNGDTCIRGHEATPDNIRVSRRGWQVCRVCDRERMRRSRAVLKADECSDLMGPGHRTVAEVGA